MSFLPQICSPNRPRTLQQDVAAVPIMRKHPHRGWCQLELFGGGRGPLRCTGHGGFMGQVTHKTKPGCPAGIAGGSWLVPGGSWLVAGPALSIQRVNLDMGVPAQPCPQPGTGGWGLLHAAARLRGVPAGWGAVASCRSCCRSPWDEDFPTGKSPKSTAPGLVRMPEAMAAPTWQRQPHECVILAMSSLQGMGLRA